LSSSEEISPVVPPEGPPETWERGRRVVERVLAPIERFLHVEAASGVVLLLTSVVALIWSNSPWGASYERLWHTEVGFRIGDFAVTRSVHFLVNDGLMVVFFFLVGLEIRREIHAGELAEPRRAALPVAAALGGMIVPAIVYFLVNRGLPTVRGWGTPMATDIAFAVGVLALLGNRVPAALRVLLLALAVIDDIGAIVIIALFYSSGVSAGGLLVAAAGLGGVFVLQRLGVRRAIIYVIPGGIIWLGCLRAGIHPTIAGVILGLVTPVRPWLGEQGFLSAARRALEEFGGQVERDNHGANDLLGPLGHLNQAHREALAPVVRLQSTLHPWVAFVIMPLFALCNAGVDLHGITLHDPATRPVFIGVALGLLVGKPVGVVTMCFLWAKLGLCSLPAGVTWRGVGLVGCVASIGFTMAIFIASLAFGESESLGAAKLAVLVASAVAGLITVGAGRALFTTRSDAHAAETCAEAEASTDK
jgi:Na+:H+ antiporter, NhaA family